MFSEETMNFFLKRIEEMIDAKIAAIQSDSETSEYGTVISVTNDATDTTKTLSAVVNILKNGIQTDEIKNNTGEQLNPGDTVRVNIINGNWNNAYINLKCGISQAK